MTILRWLDLRAGELLELERGEDIDLIGQAVDGAQQNDTVMVRELEQIRNRIAPLTLRSPEVRAALAHFHTHRRANPGLSLILRYTTTAGTGIERSPSGIEGSAIEAWRAFRESKGPVDEQTVLAPIRELLTGGQRPKGVTPENWDAYQAFIVGADANSYRQFVSDVEWSFGMGDAGLIAVAIRERLLVRSLAVDAQQAEALLDRLQAYVWNLLTRDGLKRLTADDLRREIEKPILGGRERERLDRLHDLLGRLEARVGMLEHDVTELARAQREVTAQAGARIEALIKDAGIRAALSYVIETPTLEEPPLVSPAASRSETIHRLAAAYPDAAWLALHGASGTGKSQLALVLAGHLASRVIWLSFRDLTIAQAAARLDAGLRRLLDDSRHGPLERADLDHLAGQLAGSSSPTCLVLDDLPRFVESDELGARLVPLIRAFGAGPVRVLSTSVYRVSLGVNPQLSSGAVAIIPTPPFTADEARELLAAHGAPETILAPSVVEIATLVTRGHPVLLQALCLNLKRKGWPPTGTEAFLALLGREPDEAVNEETLQRVLNTVEDAQSRQLLGRLTLAHDDFELADAQALADVVPAIDVPRSRLHQVTGLWVQAETKERYSLSPLVRDLGAVDVTPDTIRGCHLALGQRIVERASMTVTEFVRAFAHFVQGGDINRAAVLLVRVLYDYSRTPSAAPGSIVTSIWVDTPIPDKLDPALRMILRAIQIRARIVSGLPTETLKADLDSLLSQATRENAWAVFGASMFMVGEDLSPESVSSASPYIRMALSTWPVVEGIWPSDQLTHPAGHIASLVWIPPGLIRRPSELSDWLDLLEAIPPSLRDEAFTEGLAPSGALQAAYGLLIAEEELPLGDRHWDTVLASLAMMEERAERIGASILWAATRGARIRVLGRELHDLPKAAMEAEKALARHLSQDEAFLVTKTIGFLYVDVSDFRAAEKWLVAAVGTRSPAYPTEFTKAALWTAVVVGANDHDRSAEIAADAVIHAKEKLDPDHPMIVDALGEAGLACWLAGQRGRGFAFWQDAGERLVARPDTDLVAASQLAVLAYPIGWAARQFRSKKSGRANGEAGDVPQRGMMLRRREFGDAPPSAGVTSLFAVMMTELAAEMGADAEAKVWAERGTGIADREGDEVTSAVLTPTWAVDALDLGDYETLLRRVMRAGRVMQAARNEDEDLNDSNSQVQAQNPLVGDHLAAVWGLLPLTLRLATLVVEGSAEIHTLSVRAAAACRAVAEDSGDPPTWIHAAEIVEQAFVHRAPAHELAAMVKETHAADEQLATALRSIAYLAVSLDPRQLPSEGLRAQLAVLTWLEPALAGHPGLHRGLTRFLLTYWRQVLDRGRFRFMSPQSVDDLLTSLSSIQASAFPGQLCRRLVKHLIDSLSFLPGTRVEGWLASEGKET